MNETLLTLHDILRWAVLAALVAGIITQFMGLKTRVNPANRVLAPVFVGLLDLQLVTGALLLFMSRGDKPLPIAHLLAMGCAVLIAHILRVRSKRADAEQAFRLQTMLYGMPMVLIVIGISVMR